MLNVTRKFFSTSTPRRRMTRAQFTFESNNNSLHFTNDSVSMADPIQSKNLAQKWFLQTKRISQKLCWSADKKNPESDSTPEYGKAHENSTLASLRKSWLRKRKPIPMNKKSMRDKKRQEQRNVAFNKARSIPNVVDDTYSITPSGGFMGNYCESMNDRESVDDSDSVDGCESVNDCDSENEEAEIRNFHDEINNCNGFIDIAKESNVDEITFENLCNQKQSQYSIDKIHTKNSIEVNEISKAVVALSYTCTPLSKGLSRTSSRNRKSSHCARICWNQQKIPRLTTYKAEKRENSKSILESSSQSSFGTTIKALHTNSIIVWNNLPKYLQYYLVAVTFCLISMIYIQFA